MWTQQIPVLVLCLCLASQQINAVVNTGANIKDSNSASSETNSEKTKEASAETVDSIAAGSEQEADKREAVIDLTGIYGTPVDTYLPVTTVNLDLPVPVYGAPNVGPNIVYSAPPPDIPPPLPTQYGVPNGLNFPIKEIYGPPKFSYGLPKHKPPRIKHGSLHHRPSHYPKPVYGPSRKPHFPKPVYGPPKQQYGPLKIHVSKPIYIPTVPEAPILSPPSATYGPPNVNVQPFKHYGLPEVVSHIPPPGVPAPPTPPDIKYDGWQPIPGLISKPLQGHYGPPQYPNDLHLSADFTPPQEGTVGIDSLGLQDTYKATGAVSDSYGAPLNTVTGSGGVVQISGEAHHQQGHQEHHQQNNYHQESSSNHHQDLNLGLSLIGLGADNSLSVVKSVGYQLQPSYASGFDSYSPPPSNSYSSGDSYSLAQSQFQNVNAAFGSHHFSKDIGLIPPSGVYGVTKSGQYGTPLFQPTNRFKGGPERPIIFRDPGLIQTGSSESARYQSHGGNTIHTAAYISPPEVTKPVKEEINEPSSLYSLPKFDRPISFQKFAHGSSSAGLSNEINFNVVDAHQSSFGGGAYALPLQQGGRYDFNSFGYQHDCNSHGSQPLPQFTYGVPSADGYTDSQDLSTSHSVKEAAKEVYAKSFGGTLAAGGELIKSQSLDLNNIPLQGALGSYTLQIQPADGLGGVGSSSSNGVPHEQVLNDGLLQSILAAIEQQPQQQNVDNNGVHSRSDEDADKSAEDSVLIPPKSDQENKISDEKTEKDNEIKVYLKNTGEDEEKDDSESYVSFKMADASYKYNLKSSNGDETSQA